MEFDVNPLITPIPLILTFLAAARITQLVTSDSIAEPIRLLASRTDWGRELIHCPWCAGFWISLATVTVVGLFWPNPVVVWGVAVLAASHIVGVLAAFVAGAADAADDED